MLYNEYRKLRAYIGRAGVSFPKAGVGIKPNSKNTTIKGLPQKSGTVNKTNAKDVVVNSANGKGVMIHNASPSRNAAYRFLNNDKLRFKQSSFDNYITDVLYRGTIGRKRINVNERDLINGLFSDKSSFKLNYSKNPGTITNQGHNVVNDISRWMELFFTNTTMLKTEDKCEAFVNLLKGKLKTDDKYQTSIVLIDIKAWYDAIEVIMLKNKKMLNNPISILVYTGYKYPNLLTPLQGVEFIITDADSADILVLDTASFTADNIPTIKRELDKFKNIITTEPDDSKKDADIEELNNEIEEISEMKNELCEKIRNILTNKPISDDIDDITDAISDIESASTQNDEVLSEFDVAMNDEIRKVVDSEFMTAGSHEHFNLDVMATRLAQSIQKKQFISSFAPVRSEAELEKIKRLTEGQITALGTPSLDDVQRKSISTSETGSIIGVSNPHIQNSKFVNFDKDYAEKQLDRDIDQAVSILANASDKIFITSKTVKDASTPMDLKKEYIYEMIDERGNKMKLAFDVPEIIDGSYIYINGSKKHIVHQMILKPIVKTAPDTVQIVTAYNKVFISRVGKTTQNMDKVQTFIDKNGKNFNATYGTTYSLNGDFIDAPIDFITMSKRFVKFEIDGKVFNMEIKKNIEEIERLTKKKFTYDAARFLPVGVDVKNKKPVLLDLSESYTHMLYELLDDVDKKKVAKIKKKPKLVTAYAKIMRRQVPLVLFMMYATGFSSVMKSANIEYRFVQKDELKEFDTMQWDAIEMADGYILWKKTPFRNELLMNGLKTFDMTPFSLSELESKDTFTSLLLDKFPGENKIQTAFDNFVDFLIDNKAKEILTDYNYPTELVPLMVTAAGMLCDNNYKIENNLDNMRIRSAEVIADIVYLQTTGAYTKYRNTAYKKKPTNVSIRKSAVIDQLLSSDTNMVEESSVINGLLEMEKRRAVTYKGLRGIQLSHAMTLPRRSFDKSMVGTFGMSTSPDANVGVVRQLTLEPAVTSTYGYIDTKKSDNPNDLNAAEVFTGGELLTPFGVRHDDPDRTAMSFKQTKYMIPVRDSDPVIVGNETEKVMPYLLSDEFVVTAKQDGVVIDTTPDFVVVKYKDGTTQAIDVATRIRKNSSNGTYIDNTFTCELSKGDKFKANDVLAWNELQFTKHKGDGGASMNLGVLVKCAIVSSWDVFEDSTPISKRAADKLISENVDEKHVTLSKHTYVDYIAKVGTKVNAGDVILRFSDANDDDLAKLYSSLREDKLAETLESAKTTISSKYTGEIVDIRIYTTLESDELHPSLKEIVDDYHKRIRKRNSVLDKYKNEGDLEYYKAGQVINEIDTVIEPSSNGKIRGHIMDVDGVLILFYIKYEMSASKGDKVVVSVCKGIVSHVWEEGMEPYSEYRPDEPIDTFAAPLSVAARKIPAIFLTLFTNKIMIELKRQIVDMFFDD